MCLPVSQLERDHVRVRSAVIPLSSRALFPDLAFRLTHGGVKRRGARLNCRRRSGGLGGARDISWRVDKSAAGAVLLNMAVFGAVIAHYADDVVILSCACASPKRNREALSQPAP